MDDLQDSTNELVLTDEAVAEVDLKKLKDLQQLWVDYRALSGLIFDSQNFDENGNWKLRTISVSEFAQRIGVHRDTLYRWQSAIPDFWQRVNQRRQELNPQSRLAKIHETWYLKAAGMKDWRITEAWLRNFDPNYKEAKTKVEHEVGNSWAALMQNKNHVIEGETVEQENG